MEIRRQVALSTVEAKVPDLPPSVAVPVTAAKDAVDGPATSSAPPFTIVGPA
ncbi:MAG: hypothetical protein WAM77_19605 [Xanthobacteraceae bacterium]